MSQEKYIPAENTTGKFAETDALLAGLANERKGTEPDSKERAEILKDTVAVLKNRFPDFDIHL